MDRSNQTIALRDGRTLGYAEYGSTDGTPVFYFTVHKPEHIAQCDRLISHTLTG